MGQEKHTYFGQESYFYGMKGGCESWWNKSDSTVAAKSRLLWAALFADVDHEIMAVNGGSPNHCILLDSTQSHLLTCDGDDYVSPTRDSGE
jgi:hypothetical protein